MYGSLAAIDRAGFISLGETTEKQPFPAGTGGCEKFRIPGLTKLKDGSLFALTDARWEKPNDDFGGIDLIYSISQDKGETWHPGYVAYFPDSLGSPEDPKDTTILIDATPFQTDDGTIHILVNLGPTGVTTGLRRPAAGSGFTENGEGTFLALTDRYEETENQPDTYGYYLGSRQADGFLPIMRKNGGESGFYTDEYFNLYKKENGQYAEMHQRQIGTGKPIVQNVFYRDSAFHVYNTMYTLHVFSCDGGKTWHWDIPAGVCKKPDEAALIASPGTAAAAGGEVIFPMYAVDACGSRNFLLFADERFESFRRSAKMALPAPFRWGGESKPVVLPDGTVRVFFRNEIRRICYADYHIGTDAWDAPVILPVLVHSDCNFGTAVHNGRILVAYARGVGSEARNRSNGRLYAFAQANNGELVLEDTYFITDGAFSYAVLTEIDEGTVGLLYDTCGDGIVLFEKIEI
ncbi:MAG: exo-alpha-sialidase [Clostridia bacterium]|nr:exo-alpha-sialidase [Clostridia bacterium]